MCIHPHANLAREKILDRKRTGKIAQRQIVVELHKQFCIRLGEKVLSGNLACSNGGERDRGLVAGTNQQLRSAMNIALADEQIEVAVAAHSWVGISLDGQNRSLDDQRSNSLLVEKLQQAKELSRQTKRQEIRALVIKGPVLAVEAY